MSYTDSTFIGNVDSVNGSVVTVRLRQDLPNLVMISGQSYRIGQIGAFVRIPLGYNNLYAVCTLVGSAAAPQLEPDQVIPGQRWMRVTLFGEAMGEVFERGVSQYPTIDDEVHLVTPKDMEIIYGSVSSEKAITVGAVAVSSGIAGRLALGPLVTRHTAIVGSTGSGKSNLVAVLIEAISTQGFPGARVLVIDPHGEYAGSVGENGKVLKINPEETQASPLYIPFWALPFSELVEIALGGNLGFHEATIRDIVTEYKKQVSRDYLEHKTPETAITADSPIPFSIRQLWFELINFERQTFHSTGGVDPCEPINEGDAEKLIANEYPAPDPYNKAPYKNPAARNIEKQLDLLRSRLMDSRYQFMFTPGELLTPSLNGEVKGDLDGAISEWVGHDKPITVMDVSGVPSEILPTVVGTLLRLIYDILFWSFDLPISGRNQPLFIVLEEAHLFLPEGGQSPAQRTVSRIAKEGRKYGVGLCIVSQRPAEIETTVLSQCGTMIALRMTNGADRSKVQSAMPDDLGSLSNMLPSLRTGEGLVIGEAMPIPSRIQFYQARRKPIGDDPDVSGAWRRERPDQAFYQQALANWRAQSNQAKEEEK